MLRTMEELIVLGLKNMMKMGRKKVCECETSYQAIAGIAP